ncbi:MAG: hypothetical protein JWO88_3790, partial [Frankiales bacterium]|nr:hypothetical protein [Frankiales bacterium]
MSLRERLSLDSGVVPSASRNVSRAWPLLYLVGVLMLAVAVVAA